MGTLVRSYFACGSHVEMPPCQRALPCHAMSLSKRFILLLNFMLAISLRTPLYISSCNCIIMSFAFLIEPYTGFPDFGYEAYSPRLSHVYPSRAFLYIFCSLIPQFLPGGDFPPSVVILHMFPCIKHRYVPLLGTSLFSPGHSSPPRLVAIKHFYSFSSFSKYLKNSKKIKINNKSDRKRCYLWQQSSRVAFEHSIVYHICWLG